MDDGERDNLVAEVADALTLDQDVDWDRCRRQATPANRRSLDNLRLVAGMFSGSEAAEASPASAATNLQPFAGVFARRAMQALMAFAAFEVAGALLLFLWGWGDIYREYGAFAVHLAVLLVGYSVTAGLFLFGGRRDRRTWLLGAYFLLKATMVNPFVFLGLLRGVPPTEPFGYPNFGYPYVYPFLFAPACLWAFARECPRVHRRTWLDDLARRMVVVSLVVGCVQSVASVAVLELTRAGYVDPALFWLGFDALLATSILLALGAVAVVVLRAHTAPVRRGQTRRALQRRVPDVHRAVCSLPCPRAVLARQLALQLSVVPGSLGGGAAAVPRGRPALVLGARGACAAPARSGAVGVPADAGAPRPARRRGGHPGGGVGPGWWRVVRTARWARWSPTRWCSRWPQSPGSCCWCLRTASGC